MHPGQAAGGNTCVTAPPLITVHVRCAWSPVRATAPGSRCLAPCLPGCSRAQRHVGVLPPAAPHVQAQHAGAACTPPPPAHQHRWQGNSAPTSDTPWTGRRRPLSVPRLPVTGNCRSQLDRDRWALVMAGWGFARRVVAVLGVCCSAAGRCRPAAAISRPRRRRVRGEWDVVASDEGDEDAAGAASGAQPRGRGGGCGDG